MKNNKLYTIWGENLDKDHVLEEYPRPYLKRNSYLNLNGIWKYKITNEKKFPVSFDGDILVPFSPESSLSGVERQVMPNDYLWYEREVIIEPDFVEGRVILHFGAVDQYCNVYINGHLAGKHIGGYLPFALDITEYITIGKEKSNKFLVMVRDTSDTSYHARGKQCLKRGGMFYTAQSGIWQTVWMESVPNYYVRDLKITPNYDKGQVTIQAELEGLKTKSTEAMGAIIEIYEGVEKILSKKMECRGEEWKINVKIPDFRSWSPEDPFLYTFNLSIGEDKIEGYFAIRKFSTEKDQNGIPRLFLNNKPYFQNGVLDQGYWPDGLYTAPSDEALIYDIHTMKELGFNMLRKHIKIEPLRWYYHCDRLGMIVWQDMVNGGMSYNYLLVTYLPALLFNKITNMKDHHYTHLARKNSRGREEFEKEAEETVKLLYNIPSIAMWVLFNEGWGQFDAANLAKKFAVLDPTRIIDHASGWFDQKEGDVNSVHIYFRKTQFIPDNRAAVISEFGGYVCRIEGHCYSKKIFGYKLFKTGEDLFHGLKRLYLKELKPGISKGLSAAVYTQVADVEDEVNGLLTYDRKVLKVKKSHLRKINQEVIKTY